MKKLSDTFLILSICATLELTCSQDHHVKSSGVEEMNLHIDNSLAANSLEDPTVSLNPYSEALYSFSTAAGKTNTAYLFDRDQDGSLQPTVQKDPVRAQTLFNRSMSERVEQRDLSNIENQTKLKKIIEIGRKYSEVIDKATKKITKNRGMHLELDRNIASRYRTEQEKAFLNYLKLQKLSISKNNTDSLAQIREQERLEIQTAQDEEKSILDAIATERSFYESKWENEKNSAENIRTQKITVSNQLKVSCEERAATEFKDVITSFQKEATIIAFNYNYLKKQADHKDPLPHGADKKDHYKNYESFLALYNSIPTDN